MANYPIDLDSSSLCSPHQHHCEYFTGKVWRSHSDSSYCGLFCNPDSPDISCATWQCSGRVQDFCKRWWLGYTSLLILCWPRRGCVCVHWGRLRSAHGWRDKKRRSGHTTGDSFQRWHKWSSRIFNADSALVLHRRPITGVNENILGLSVHSGFSRCYKIYSGNRDHGFYRPCTCNLVNGRSSGIFFSNVLVFCAGPRITTLEEN